MFTESSQLGKELTCLQITLSGKFKNHWKRKKYFLANQFKGFIEQEWVRLS